MEHEVVRPQTEIAVTQAEIDRGERASAANCPVALALKKHLTDPHVTVTSTQYRNERGDWCRMENPDAVTRFVLDFDAGRPVKPFTFTIHLATTGGRE